jgi:hypothetical protein
MSGSRLRMRQHTSPECPHRKCSLLLKSCSYECAVPAHCPSCGFLDYAPVTLDLVVSSTKERDPYDFVRYWSRLLGRR